jgi:hypothetical protein
VRNSGTITATLGTVALASGNSFTLDMYGDKLITLGVNDQIAGQVKDFEVTDSGEAEGQTIVLVTHEADVAAFPGELQRPVAQGGDVLGLEEGTVVAGLGVGGHRFGSSGRLVGGVALARMMGWRTAARSGWPCSTRS